MEQISIKAGNKRYLSELDEFKNGLPFGIINKTKTDVGGTYCAINCESNYIVVCPFIDLVKSIVADENNRYPVFGLYGGIKEASFIDYVGNNRIKKIAVTYDSLPKLIRWLGDVSSYKLLVDEYQMILEDMDYRTDAIDGLMNEIGKFSHYSFLSATPIDVNYEINFFKNLPHYKVDWNNLQKVNVIRGRTPNVYQSTVNIINEFNSEEGIVAQDINGNYTKVAELYIFLNSVKGIKQILDTLKLEPDEVKVCCANRNRNRLLLGKYAIESVCSPNKPINFFTKKCFQGCNLFSNNGLIIVVSDGCRDYTLVDVSTAMEQIIGRLRTNDKFQNVFRNVCFHIFSTNGRIKTDEEFTAIMTRKEEDAARMLMAQDKLTPDELNTFISKMDLESDIVSLMNGKLEYNELKKQSFIYKQELKKSYRNGLSILKKFELSDKFNPSFEQDFSALDVVMSKATIISYERLLKDYLANPSDSYEIEYPEFPDIKKYLTEKEMNTLRWNKDKMIKAVTDKKKLNKVFRKIYVEGFISNFDLKEKFKKEFEKEGISITPTASLIEQCHLYTVEPVQKKIDKKNVRGYILGRNLFTIL
jgi:hypothetical protein